MLSDPNRNPSDHFVQEEKKVIFTKPFRQRLTNTPLDWMADACRKMRWGSNKFQLADR